MQEGWSQPRAWTTEANEWDHSFLGSPGSLSDTPSRHSQRSFYGAKNALPLLVPFPGVWRQAGWSVKGVGNGVLSPPPVPARLRQ